jgi:acetyl-CoA carboxylase biotin carboxylase subunit
MEYDPLLAKLAVWGADRAQAIDRMIRALREYDVGGIRTNIGFFRQILEDPELRAGRLHTGFIDEFFERHHAPQPPADLAAVAALAAGLHATSRAGTQGHPPAAGAPPRVPSGPGASRPSAWLASGRNALLR